MSIYKKLNTHFYNYNKNSVFSIRKIGTGLKVVRFEISKSYIKRYFKRQKFQNFIRLVKYKCALVFLVYFYTIKVFFYYFYVFESVFLC